MSDRSVKQIVQDVHSSITTLGNEISSHSSVMGLLSSGSVIRNVPIQSQDIVVNNNLVSLKTSLVEKVAHHLADDDPGKAIFRQCLDSQHAVLGTHIDYAIRTHLREMLQAEHAKIEESLSQVVAQWMAKITTLETDLATVKPLIEVMAQGSSTHQSHEELTGAFGMSEKEAMSEYMEKRHAMVTEFVARETSIAARKEATKKLATATLTEAEKKAANDEILDQSRLSTALYTDMLSVVSPYTAEIIQLQGRVESLTKAYVGFPVPTNANKQDYTKHIKLYETWSRQPASAAKYYAIIPQLNFLYSSVDGKDFKHNCPPDAKDGWDELTSPVANGGNSIAWGPGDAGTKAKKAWSSLQDTQYVALYNEIVSCDQNKYDSFVKRSYPSGESVSEMISIDSEKMDGLSLVRAILADLMTFGNQDRSLWSSKLLRLHNEVKYSKPGQAADIGANLRRIEEMITQAAAKGARLDPPDATIGDDMVMEQWWS